LKIQSLYFKLNEEDPADFIDHHQALVEHKRRDLQHGLKKPATGRHGLDAPQVLRSLALMRFLATQTRTEFSRRGLPRERGCQGHDAHTLSEGRLLCLGFQKGILGRRNHGEAWRMGPLGGAPVVDEGDLLHTRNSAIRGARLG